MNIIYIILWVIGLFGNINDKLIEFGIYFPGRPLVKKINNTKYLKRINIIWKPLSNNVIAYFYVDNNYLGFLEVKSLKQRFDFNKKYGNRIKIKWDGIVQVLESKVYYSKESVIKKTINESKIWYYPGEVLTLNPNKYINYIKLNANDFGGDSVISIFCNNRFINTFSIDKNIRIIHINRYVKKLDFKILRDIVMIKDVKIN